LEHTAKSSHYGFLDTLRTIAVMLVLLRHTIRYFLPDISPDSTIDDAIWAPVRNLMANGWVGVDLFFLLSGFLITQPFLKSPKTSIKKFYRNRALRIFPAYFTVLILIVIGAFPFYSMPTETPLKEIIYHIFFLQDYTGTGINTVFWSLGVEVKFYLLAPFILVFIGRYVQSNQWLKAYALTIAIIAIIPFIRFLIYTSHGDIEDYYEFWIMLRSPFHACIDGLFFGVLLAIIFKQIEPHIKTDNRPVQLLFAVLSAFLICFIGFSEFRQITYQTQLDLFLKRKNGRSINI